MHRANSVRHADSMNGGAAGGGHSNHTNLLNKFAANQQRKSSGGGFVAIDKSTVASERSKLIREPSNPINKTPIVGGDDTTNENHHKSQLESSEQSQPQQVYLKSCLSDGDFNEVLIKVNDDQDDHMIGNDRPTNRAQIPPDQVDGANSLSTDHNNHLDESTSKNRRRSSCSDAEDSKLVNNK